MSNAVKFSVDDVLNDVEQAFKGGRTRLLSQTLYQFFPDENKLTIQDFDVIVLCGQCRQNIPKVTLKTIRKAHTPKGSFFECDDVAGVKAAIRGQAVNGVRLDISDKQNGLMDICLNAPHLHAGKIYVVRIDYDVPLNRDSSAHLMFSGAIQPSDYQGFCGAIGIPVDAKKTMEVVVFSKHNFSAWFYDPGKNEYSPPVVEPEFLTQRSGYLARHPFHHEITGNDLRARYFSMFVNYLQKSRPPGNEDWDTSGDVPLGVGA